MKNFIMNPFCKKATVCIDKTCVTVYGNTAKTIQAIAVVVAIIMAIVYISKVITLRKKINFHLMS